MAVLNNPVGIEAAMARLESGLAPRLPGRIPSLNGLRALSILLVLIAHAADTRDAPTLLGRLVPVGNLGVRTFFVISGFLITTLLLREWEATGSVSLRRFYTRRVLRIFPALYVYIIIISQIGFEGPAGLRPGDLACAVSFTMNYHYDRGWLLNHLWSLAVEEQFYLIWPAAFVLLGPRRAMVAAASALIACPMIRAAMWSLLGASQTAMTRQFQAVADALAAGCLLAGLYNWLGKRGSYARLVASPLFLILPMSALAVSLATAGLGRGAFYVAGQSIANLAIAFGVDWCLRHPGSVFGRLLNSPKVEFVGILSYSLYLWQEPFLNPFDQRSPTSAFPLNLAMAVMAALASYYAVEQPLLRIKARMHRATRSPSRAESTPLAP